MSLQAAIGRIDSIISLQQQILDPAAAASSGSSAVDTALTRGGQTFSDLLAGAQSGGAGATGATGASGTMTASTTGTDPISAGVSEPLGSTLSGTTTGAAGLTGAASSAGAPAQVQAMTQMAESLVGKPYVWGGGHGGWGPQRGYDCSGFVSTVLHAGGYLSTPQDTTSMPSAAGMAQGPGQYVTVYDRTGSGEGGHVIIDIAGQFYESGGGHGAWGGGGGVERIGRPSDSYLATFDTQLHPQGL